MATPPAHGHFACSSICRSSFERSTGTRERNVIVSVESLSCFDCLVWLRTGENAARRLEVDQATIVRNARKVAAAFEVSLDKQAGEWQVLGDSTLLNLERGAHQLFRWQMDLPLRVEAQYYSGPLFLAPHPPGWLAGNFDFLQVAAPLQHLRQGVIDAWIGCHPDVPEEEDDELACFPLTRLPTHLVVADGHPLLRTGEALTLADVRRYPSLALPDGAFPKVQAALQELGLWNDPREIGRYNPAHWEGRTADQVTVGYATVLSIGLFPVPQVILPLPIPLEVGDTLVVRRRFSEHPRCRQLLEGLQQRAQQLAARHPEVRIPCVR
jgi:DNA-binding transcriptional LysR family regulator